MLAVVPLLASMAAFSAVSHVKTDYNILMAAADNNSSNGQMNNNVDSGTSGKTSNTHSTTASGGDAEVLTILNTLDNGEVSAALEAKNKKLTGDVEDFAEEMRDDHQKHMDKIRELAEKAKITPATSSATADKLKTKAESDLAAIRDLEDKAFENSFMNMMITSHTEALGTIDNQLMSMARNSDVKKFLSKTRKTIADHLEKAKKVQGDLNK
jgi:putative membrane protein